MESCQSWLFPGKGDTLDVCTIYASSRHSSKVRTKEFIFQKPNPQSLGASQKRLLKA
jgi:hypothetical protein